MPLDDIGQRVPGDVGDESQKRLSAFDTANGNLVQHTAPYGAPIQVAVDTVAAKQSIPARGAHSSTGPNLDEGTLATTGNDLASLRRLPRVDGFGSTNQRLFEALTPPANPALDAEIGHIGLVDNFSTVVGGSASLNPHDVLVALLDQGGLAPDRSGMDRTGQVDPSAPPAAAALMAQQLALVIAGDLPTQLTGAIDRPEVVP